MTSGSIVNFPLLSGDVPRLPSYGIYISQLVRFARCCTSVLDFHSKNLQVTSILLISRTFGKFFRSYSELPTKFGAISFQEYVSKGITHPVFYGDLVYFLPNLVQYRFRNMYLKESLTRSSTVIWQGTLTPPDTWSRPFGTCICSNCWDQSCFRTCRYFFGLCSSNNLGYFLSILLQT